MTRLGLALRLFFRTLGSGQFARAAEPLLGGTVPRAGGAEPARAKPAAGPPPAARRSDALNLLSALQRDARFVDFIKEPIAAYTDAQIGAAVRDVHRGCSEVLDRLFALRPVLEAAEGSATQVPAAYDAGRIRLTGSVGGPPPYQGTIRHGGWAATKLELPAWSGSDGAAMVVAPAEVEVAG